jgi:hypothetical protein
MTNDWNDNDIEDLLITIRRIDQDFWMEGERHILPDPNAPKDAKEDFINVLEVINSVYEDEFPLATERFKQLTQDQKELLLILVSKASEECDCSNCIEERVQRENSREQAMLHHRKMTEISRNKTYQVSEDIFTGLMDSQKTLSDIIGRLESAIELLDEDDPRHGFAINILESIF